MSVIGNRSLVPSDARSTFAGLRAREREAGFTLIELLVALAISALLTGIAFPALQHQLKRSAQIEARMTLALVLTQARADAIAQAVPTRVSWSAARRILQSSSGRPAAQLPPQASLEWPEQGFIFFADGTANGGIGAIRTTARGGRFSVDGGTSRIVFEP
jgi:prepilin-type N-terminal cleavage/methylation domain-containing protein